MRSFCLAFIASLLIIVPAAAVPADYVGKPFPDFSATDPITKQKFSLGDFKGKVVLVDFWATWCPPCRAEIPNLKKTYDKYKDQGLVIVSISLDNDAAKFKSYVAGNGMKWVHVMDGGGWGTRLAKKYGINSIPAMFLLDHSGVCITDSARGGSLGPAVEKALKKAKDAAPAKPKTVNVAPAAPKPEANRDPAMLEQWRQDAGQAEHELAAAAKPLEDFAIRVSVAKKAPAGESASDAADAAVAGGDAAALREEAFMIGLLNNPANMPTTSSDSAAVLDQADRAAQDARRQFTEMSAKIASLTTKFESGSVKPEQWKTQSEQTLGEARALVQRWSPAWKRQLNSLSGVLDQIGQRDAQLLKRIDAAERTLADIRYRQAGAGGADRVRSVFNALRGELVGIRALMTGLPPDAAVVPAQPASTDLEADIKVMGQTIVQLRQQAIKMEKSSQRLRDEFGPRARALQAELAQAKDAQAEEAIQKRYAALCKDILAAWDQR